MDISQIRARDLMHKEVKCVEATTSLQATAKLLREWGVSSVVVAPESDSDAFGILTRKDVVEAFVTMGAAAVPLTVADVMTKPCITVTPDLAIPHCLQLMRMVGVRRLPVVEGGEILGILSNTDVFRWLVNGLD